MQEYPLAMKNNSIKCRKWAASNFIWRGGVRKKGHLKVLKEILEIGRASEGKASGETKCRRERRSIGSRRKVGEKEKRIREEKGFQDKKERQKGER